MKKTKIIATMGPSCESKKVLTEMVKNGLNVARINFSHGNQLEYKKSIDLIKAVRKEQSAPLAIMVDTRGPEVRVKTFKNGSIVLKKGQLFTLYKTEKDGDETGVSITEPSVLNKLNTGNIILANDGLIEFKVVEKTKQGVTLKVLSGGKLSNNKGLTFKGIDLDLPYLSEKDKNDLIFAVENDCDFIACSFVTKAQDIMDIRNLLSTKDYTCKLIAKIESQEGIKNLETILDVADGVMVARGDLGVEYPVSKLPSLQSKILECARNKRKFSIVATEMLESMISNPRPTRAEVSDVANAIREGASAIMLSAESSVGKYPVKAVSMMKEISNSIENTIDYDYLHKKTITNNSVVNITVNTAIDLSCKLMTKGIAVCTSQGKIANFLACQLPKCDIYAITNSLKTYYSMALYRGVYPIYIPKFKEENIFKSVDKILTDKKLVKSQDNIVVLTGTTDEFSNVIKVNVIK